MDLGTEVTVVRVFTDEADAFGNHLGLVDGRLVAEEYRQGVAHALGYAETVFIDDPDSGTLRIFTPKAELPLAGHPLVGSAWFLHQINPGRPAVLWPPAGEVPVRIDGETVYISAEVNAAPPWTLVQLATPEEIDALVGPLQPEHDHVAYFARRPDGALRVRVFAPLLGVAEDEATGSAAMRLVALLGGTINIRQGAGSRIVARLLGDGRAEIGGRVVLDGRRPIPAPN